MTYDRKDPNEVLVHAQEATWEDGQRLGVKDGPFGLISYQPLKAGVALSFDTPARCCSPAKWRPPSGVG